MKSSRYGLYGLGNSRATVIRTKCKRICKNERNFILKIFFFHKNLSSSNCFLKFENMKTESLVIVKQRVTVNTVPKLSTHRPSRQGTWWEAKFFFQFLLYIFDLSNFLGKKIFSLRKLDPWKRKDYELSIGNSGEVVTR